MLEPTAQEVAVVTREAARLRLSTLDQITSAGFGHLGSCFSCAELVACAFEAFDLQSFDSPGSDLFVLSKGHAAPMLYAAMCPDSAQLPYAVTGSPYPGHPNALVTPNVTVSTGSVGFGLPIGLGIALGHVIRRSRARVIVIAGDGELQAGMTWEALLNLATRPELPILFIVDANGYQGGMAVPTNDVIAHMLTRLPCSVRRIDGNDPRAVLSTMRSFAIDPRTTIVWADTRRGAGARIVENNPLPMTWRPNAAELADIRGELHASMAD